MSEVGKRLDGQRKCVQRHDLVDILSFFVRVAYYTYLRLGQTFKNVWRVFEGVEWWAGYLLLPVMDL